MYVDAYILIVNIECKQEHAYENTVCTQLPVCTKKFYIQILQMVGCNLRQFITCTHVGYFQDHARITCILYIHCTTIHST